LTLTQKNQMIEACTTISFYLQTCHPLHLQHVFIRFDIGCRSITGYKRVAT
jgi:hypothetical protein